MGNSEAKQKAKEQEKLKKLEEREKLVATAVLFLGGKGIAEIPEPQKRIFLLKKGLTDEMIQEAYKRFEKKKAEPAVSPNAIVLPEAVTTNTMTKGNEGKENAHVSDSKAQPKPALNVNTSETKDK